MPATANENHVTLLFDDILNRTPSTGELSALTAQLDSGVSLSQISLNLQTTAEGRSATVSDIFQEDLDRAPDQASLDFWSAQLQTQSIELVRAQILGSAEFFVKAGGTNAGFLEGLYQSVLHRSVDTGGSSYFGGLLNSGTSRTEVAAYVLTSIEGRADQVRDYYQKYLGRAPEAAGLTSWVEQLAAGSPAQVVIAGITSSPEYQGRLPAGTVSITSPGNQSTSVGANVRVQIAATASNGGTLSYTADNLPQGLAIGTTGLISGIINANALSGSPYTVTVTASDGVSPVATTTFTWTVTAATPLAIIVPATQSNANGTTVDGVAVTTTGATADPISFSATNLPPGLAINSTTGVISGTISASGSHNSPYNVTVSVTQNGVTKSASFTWVVPISSTSTLPFSLTDDGWITLPSGTRYKDVVVGTGDAAAVGDSINVDYAGYLTDGTSFDSNNGVTFTLQAGSLIDGWVEAIPGMKPGGVRLLDIPSTEAYGSTPRTGIPANSELVFRVALNSIA